MGLNFSHAISVRMRPPAHGLVFHFFALTTLYGPDFVPLLLVGWQSPSLRFTIASEYSAGMKSLATFGATINLISIRNNILLITPVIHIFPHKRQSVLNK